MAKKRKKKNSDPGWPMIFGVLGALILFLFAALQTRSLCGFDGKIPQPPTSKAGQFHLQGPQIGRKASKALEKGNHSGHTEISKLQK